MKNTLTVTEIKEKFTNKDIENIFKSEGMYIKTAKGKTVVFNKAEQMFYLDNHVLAYHYFLEMNWL